MRKVYTSSLEESLSLEHRKPAWEVSIQFKSYKIHLNKELLELDWRDDLAVGHSSKGPGFESQLPQGSGSQPSETQPVLG